MAKILHLPAQCSFVGVSPANRANALSDGAVVPQGSGGNAVFESSVSGYFVTWTQLTRHSIPDSAGHHWHLGLGCARQHVIPPGVVMSRLEH